MPTVLESVSSFLAAQASRGIAPDLLSRWNPAMETQVNVVSGEEIELPNDKKIYSKGVDTFWPIRIPKNADSNPFFNDYHLDWPLDLFAKEIGCTGHDYVNGRSRWVAFDFDSIAGHAEGVGISDAELEAVRERACALPYVEVRRSTGGAGYHLYVAVDVPTANHTEHAAVGRAVLAKMSADADFSFSDRVDCAGGNMWIWRRGLEPGGAGLSLVKAATREIGDVGDWRQYLKTAKAKTKSANVPDVALDDKHRELIAKLDASPYVCNWLHEHHLVHTHTKGLEDVYKAGGIDGVFCTTSRGDDPATPNCFMFPMVDGAWRVYRFGTPSEAPTWKVDDHNHTWCIYNRGESVVTPSDAELRYPLLNMRELLSADFQEKYIVEDVLIGGMPAIFGGAPKTLKTAQLIDLGFNLAIGGKFLGRFACHKSRVVILTGESGGAAIQKRARTLSRVYGAIADDDFFSISQSLPKFQSDKDLALLGALFASHKTQVAIIDPLYMCMGGAEASNIQSQGELLWAISDCCRANGVTLVVAHHVTKAAAKSLNRVLGLEDLTQAGFDAWARQWWMISRREEFVRGSGKHKLLVGVGNSSSHSAEWAIDIDEGTRDRPCWEVAITDASDVRAVDAAKRRQDKVDADIAAVEAVLSTGPLSASAICKAAGINSDRWRQYTFPTLKERDLITSDSVKRGYHQFVWKGEP